MADVLPVYVSVPVHYPVITDAIEGSLLDVAAYKGVEMRGDTYEITVADLEGTMAKQNVKINAGDAIIINTGWGRLHGKDNARFVKSTPGVGTAAAEWIVKQDPLRVGSDTMNSRSRCSR